MRAAYSLVSAIALLSSLLLSVSPVNGASLLAIDYGTDGFKAALIKPGVPFDVLINKDSKRKTGSIVTLRGEERSFGGEAANLATRFPRDTFQSIKLLLGHPSSHPQSILHNSLYHNPPSTTPRGSPSISSSTASYAVEEILAMQFGYAKDMAEGVAGEGVRDAVITVPNWFGMSERTAVLDAAELAGLRCIGLVNDGTASAVNYAMSRTFPPAPSYHLFYDFGAGSLTTTLVSLRSALLPDPLSLAANPELKNVTSLKVHGMGHDTTVGGLVFDRIVRDIMKEEFESATGKKVEGDLRAMAKLLREAARVKQVLSANGASVARIEGLIDDVDFKATVTREQLESRSKDLLPRFTQPIEDALASANLTMADIESVILIGGSSRVPMVEAAVRNFVGEEKIAKNVNADEAAVMGAALYGAGITRGFRTKDIRVQDITPFAIDVAYDADKVSEDAEPRRITTHLFPALSKLGVKKTMTFKKAGDFAIHFSYRKSGAISDFEQPDDLFETTVSGLDLAFANLTAEAIANSTVKVTIELNESNVVSVVKAVVILPEEAVNATAPTMNDRLKGFLNFGGKKDSPEDESGGDDKKEKDAKYHELEDLLKATGPVVSNSTVRLVTSTQPLGRIPMTNEEKSDAKKRLRDARIAETKKLAREEARNVLEAFIYKARDLIQDSAFIEASIESERDEIKKLTEESNEWLWDEGDKASTKDLKSKKASLEKLVKQINTRSIEATQRPPAIDSLRKTLTTSSTFLASSQANNTLSLAAGDLPRFTDAELESLDTLIKTNREWLDDLVEKQNAVKGFEDPVLRVAELQKREKELDVVVDKLRKKKAPRKPKVVKSKKVAEVVQDKEGDSKVEGKKVEPVAAKDGDTASEGERKADEPTASTSTVEEPKSTGEPVSDGERVKDEL